MNPTGELFEVAHAMSRDLWDGTIAAARSQTASLDVSLNRIDREIGQVLDRVVEAGGPTIESV